MSSIRGGIAIRILLLVKLQAKVTRPITIITTTIRDRVNKETLTNTAIETLVADTMVQEITSKGPMIVILIGMPISTTHLVTDRHIC